jgi:NTP pyrophosphatase (non-canonical NTP hydrolase)
MKDFEERIRKHMAERGWDNLKPSDLAKSIMIEGAELLENFQWSNQSAAEVRENAEKLAKVRNELSDVMIYCFDLAVTLNIDVEQALNEKLDRVQEKYPTTLFNPGNRDTNHGDKSEYWKIKEAHRVGEK